MDVRVTGPARDIPALGLYGIETGQTARAAAGEDLADLLDRDVLVSLLLQPDVYEAADDEATQALADLLVLGGHLNPPAPDPGADVSEEGEVAEPAPRPARKR